MDLNKPIKMNWGMVRSFITFVCLAIGLVTYFSADMSKASAIQISQVANQTMVWLLIGLIIKK